MHKFENTQNRNIARRNQRNQKQHQKTESSWGDQNRSHYIIRVKKWKEKMNYHTRTCEELLTYHTKKTTQAGGYKRPIQTRQSSDMGTIPGRQGIIKWWYYDVTICLPICLPVYQSISLAIKYLYMYIYMRNDMSTYNIANVSCIYVHICIRTIETYTVLNAYTHM